MDLVFATHNASKVREVRPLLPSYIRLLTLRSLGYMDEIAETGATLEENALLKARYVLDRYGLPCFADDTGLLVKSLNDAPGVFSARYAGKDNNAEANMRKLLGELEGHSNREARFETVIALVSPQDTHTFKGVVQGEITLSPTGAGGFGYDPIFRPQGETRTFAQLPLAEKNRISHRARALQQLITFLKTRNPGA